MSNCPCKSPGPILLAMAAGSLAYALAGFVQDGAESRSNPDPETVIVPFQMLPSNHMVVEAKLNGKGPYRLIFDLGAPVTLLSNRAAEAVGAIDKSAPKSFMMGARGEGKVAKVEFGDLEAEDVPVIVMDHPVLKALGGAFGRRLEGIVGYTFWAHYKMTIDYQAKEMTFTPVDFEVRDLMKDLPSRLAGPKQAKTLVLAPKSLFGLEVGEPEGGVASKGVPVKAVASGSPAEAAGVEVGDVLASLDGRWTNSVSDAFAAALGVEPGRDADLVVVRDGEEQTLTVTPAEGL